MAFKRISHVTIALHPRLAAVSGVIRGCCPFFHGGPVWPAMGKML